MCSRVREPRAAAPGECAPAEQFRPGASRRRTDPQPAAARTRPARPPAAVADRRVTMSPPAPNPVDAAALADELARFRVVDPARMSALLAEFPGDGPDALADYLAWPLVEGPSLADRVAADGPLPPGEVAAALAHLLAGLAALHARRAVHGVITPRAVVLPAAAPPQLLELGAGTILAEDLTADE